MVKSLLWQEVAETVRVLEAKEEVLCLRGHVLSPVEAECSSDVGSHPGGAEVWSKKKKFQMNTGFPCYSPSFAFIKFPRGILKNYADKWSADRPLGNTALSIKISDVL